MVSNNKKASLLGLGLDNEDEQVRVTKGENFHLVGGSHDTHEQMQEKCIKFNEKLKARGKQLEELGKEEMQDIAADCDMNIQSPDKPDPKANQ